MYDSIFTFINCFSSRIKWSARFKQPSLVLGTLFVLPGDSSQFWNDLALCLLFCSRGQWVYVFPSHHGKNQAPVYHTWCWMQSLKFIRLYSQSPYGASFSSTVGKLKLQTPPGVILGFKCRPLQASVSPLNSSEFPLYNSYSMFPASIFPKDSI